MSFPADVLPVLYTIFLWWVSTGIIFLVYRRSRKFVQWSFVGGTLLLVVAFAGILLTRSLHHPRDLYLAVTCAVLVWAWQVASYYLGFVTGPHNKHHLIHDAGWERSLLNRFRLAVHFSIYHEFLAAATGVLIALLTWSSPNRWALWMYLALWLMHLSAKLNVFLGVRNFRIELLPRQMHYMGGLLGKRRMNPLFPFSVLLACVLAWLLFYQGLGAAADPTQSAGFLIVGTMVILGLIEHLMLVLPIPAAVLGMGILPLTENTEPAASSRSNLDSTSHTITVTGD